MNQNPEQNAQSLVEHLTELRTRVVRALLIVVGGFLACWGYSERIIDVIRKPIAPFLKSETGGLVYLGVMDKFIAHLKVSFLAGVILTCPLWLYQVWKFIEPGLYQKEKKYSMGFIGFGSAMFLIGVSFAYFLVFPSAFKFLLNFGGSIDTPMITLAEYISFFLVTTLVFGAAFELPLIIVILGMLGIVSDKTLRQYRRFAIVGLAVISAVLTPPDAISMFMLLIPLVGLYEISIVLVRIFQQRPQLSNLPDVRPPESKA